jgi:small-conductance mechanosensitive channel
VQERWEAIGHVPRADTERVEARLRKVEETVRRGDQERWRRTNPEARARAEDTVAQFRGSLQRLQDELEQARTRGDERAAADLQARIDSTTGLLQAAERAAEEFGG